MGKSTISTWPFSIAMLVYQRVHHGTWNTEDYWSTRILRAKLVTRCPRGNHLNLWQQFLGISPGFGAPVLSMFFCMTCEKKRCPLPSFSHSSWWKPFSILSLLFAKHFLSIFHHVPPLFSLCFWFSQSFSNDCSSQIHHFLTIKMICPM